MTYAEFETYINAYVNTVWTSTDAVVVSEYLATEITNQASMNISVSISDSEEGNLGKVGPDNNKSYNISGGTVTLLLKLPADFGLPASISLIQKAIELFSNKMLNNGYIKFRPSYKVDGGVNEGSIFKRIICPFQIETIQ